MPDPAATAEGDLARTPFAHLLVYAVDRRLTGVLFLTEPGGVQHVVRIARGAPVKVRPGDRYALLGELLVEAGALSEATLAAALETQGLLGDVLLLAGCVERDLLEATAQEQFVRRMIRLFELPKETTYRYCDEHDALCDYGGEPASVDPLALIWAGLRAHGDASVMMESTLALLAEAPLRLHTSATIARFGLQREEAELIEHVTAGACPLSELVVRGTAPEVVRRLAYALVITRQVDLGGGGSPVGASDSIRRPSATLAKMQLRSTVHRHGAAAPDPPGDGERVSVSGQRMRDGAPRSASPSSRTPVEGEPGEGNADAPSSSVRTESGVRSTGARSTPRAPIDDDPVIVVVADPDGLADEPLADDEPAAVGSTTPSGTSEPRARIATDAPAIAGAVGELAQGRSIEAPAPALSAAELFRRASALHDAGDLDGAGEACAAGLVAAPGDPDLLALAVWVQASVSGGDVKALSIALDELLGAREGHVQARFYRAMLRKRLGDAAGMQHDLRRVLELAPEHVDATRELEAIDRPPPKRSAGFLRRLLGR